MNEELEAQCEQEDEFELDLYNLYNKHRLDTLVVGYIKQNETKMDMTRYGDEHKQRVLCKAMLRNVS